MPIVVDLDWCIDPQGQWHFFGLAVLTLNLQFNLLPRLDPFAQTSNTEKLRPIQFQRLCVNAVPKLQRQNTHSNQITAVNSLKARRNDSLDSQQPRPLCRPVAAGARSIF